MQQLWRKRYVNAGWITLSAVSLVLLIAAVHSKNHRICKDIHVEINGSGNNFFVDTKEVIKALTATGPVKGEPAENINLRVLESRLKKDKWIADAQLFFDNDEVLRAVVEEKDPVARIFTVEGSSFYIDSACNHLPLSDKLSARVPMFTNFPTDKTKLSRPDSALMASVKDLALFIQGDDFWKAQVAQIDITPDGFEMVPTVGDHIVELGNGEDLQQKFDRLFSFYKQVWTKVGFEKYEKINVQYDGQVVATKRGAASLKVDSAKAKEAVNDLMLQTKQANEALENGDSSEISPATSNNAQQQAVTNKQEAPVVKQTTKTQIKQQPKQTQKIVEKKKTVFKAASKPVVVKKVIKQNKKSSKPAENVKVPKAIMKKAEDRR